MDLLTIFCDGCTDFLFDKADPNPKYVFRLTNIQSADGITAAIGTAHAWPHVRRIAHLHPDYSYGRNAAEHFWLAIERLIPITETVSESWPKLGTTDFTAHITKILSSKPDLLFTSVWGGSYVAFYKQAMRYGLFDQMKVATTLALGVVPHAIGKDHPEGVLAGVHANYHFTYPAGDRWPENTKFVQKYYKRWNEYPNFQSEGSYVALHMLRTAIERANRLAPGWPEDEAIISQLEGLGYGCPVGLHLYPAGQSPGLQGHGDRVQQEHGRLSFPGVGSRPGHHHSYPQYHGSRQLAEAGQRPRRARLLRPTGSRKPGQKPWVELADRPE